MTDVLFTARVTATRTLNAVGSTADALATTVDSVANLTRMAADTTAQMREDRLYALKRDAVISRQAAVDKLAAKHAAFYDEMEQDLDKNPRRKAYFDKIRNQMQEGEALASQILESERTQQISVAAE